MHFGKLPYQVISAHLLFWLVYSILNAYSWETFDRSYNAITYYGLTRLPVKLAAVYINYFLLTKLFFRKKYLIFSFLFLANLASAGLIQTFISTSGIFNYQNFTQYSLPVYSVVILSSVVILIRQFIVKVKESKQLEIEKIKTELSLLKAQLQPHFLFNTLNNIYSLTLDNSKLAGKCILQLSALLRYLIYESQAQTVDLQKEIDHLKNYIELEKIRFAQRLDLSFNISGDTADKKIPPVLLMPFLENAFKHASSKLNEKIWITIDLIVKDLHLYFTIENSVAVEGSIKEQPPHSGVGLVNVKRRLSLLYENYVLETGLKDNYFHTFLAIPFNEKV